MPHSQKVAVVSGTSRGLGREVACQLARQGILVIMTSRDRVKGREICEQLQKTEELTVRHHPLDVDHAASIEQLLLFVEREFGRCDILVNNAGILIDTQDQGTPETSVFRAKVETLRRTMTTNVYGPLLLSQAFIPLMRKNGYGRIVNFSSGMGQLSDMGGGYPAYRMSKTALNALTRIMASELDGDNILVNSLCPGWVRTDMGGPDATRSVEEGADTAVWLATLPDDGPSGGFFRDRKAIPW